MIIKKEECDKRYAELTDNPIFQDVFHSMRNAYIELAALTPYPDKAAYMVNKEVWPGFSNIADIHCVATAFGQLQNAIELLSLNEE